MSEIDGIRSTIRQKERAQREASNQQKESERRAAKKRPRGAQQSESSELEATSPRFKRASTGSNRSESERGGEQEAIATGRSRQQVEIEEGASSSEEGTFPRSTKGTQSQRNVDHVSDSESQEENVGSRFCAALCYDIADD